MKVRKVHAVSLLGLRYVKLSLAEGFQLEKVSLSDISEVELHVINYIRPNRPHDALFKNDLLITFNSAEEMLCLIVTDHEEKTN